MIVLCSAVSFLAANTAFSVSNEIYHGVSVADIDVSGLSENAASQKIQTALQVRMSEPIRLIYGTKVWQISANDIELHVDTEKLANDAYNIGRKGNIFEQLTERYLTANQGQKIPIAVTYSSDKLHQILLTIGQEIDQIPQNAAIRVNGFEIVHIPEQIGHKLNIEQTIADITSRINSTFSFELKLAVDDHIPTVTLTDIRHIDRVLATYTTQFNASDSNRSENIYLAARSVNGSLVRQGENFSFNSNVGPRLAQFGYKEAPVFIDGKLVPDWGGGVCQVSSTLYNAVLLADMTIDERTAHFRPPGYVPLGQDATVADNLLDFRFRNTSANNIYVIAEASGNQITVSILGKSADMPEIYVTATDTKTIDPKTVIKQDASLDLGKQEIEVEGQKGFMVTTHRIKRINGTEISRELLAVDEFKPIDHVVRVGTKALPTKGSK